ncbi:MAG: HNH endonuclease [Janthinobacterium lividum]
MRDKGRCQACGVDTRYATGHMFENSYHMAHIKAKRMGGDSLENVRTLCGRCHRNEHNAGGKPCPRKPRPV